MTTTRAGILIFTAAVLAGPWYSVAEYNPLTHVISLLGAQNTPNSFIMVAGFLALGFSIFIDGMREFNKPVIPFMAFGIFTGLAGLLAHKPIAPSMAHNELMHQAHSLLATLAGISITVGLLWQAALLPASWRRVMTLLLAILCLALPLSMLAFEDSQGLIQRYMYLLIFAWFWIYYPLKLQKSRERKTNA